MEIKTFVILVGLVFAILIQDSNAIKCYVCGKASVGGSSSSTSDADCGDPFKKEGVTTIDCTGSCMKTKAETNGVKVVARACLPMKMSDDCKSEGGVDLCYCDKELCNTAPTLKFSNIAFFAIVAGSIAFKLYL